MTITIVGSGIAGSYLAYKLSKTDDKIIFLEEDEIIGIPKHCTGLVTNEIFSYEEIPQEIIINHFQKAKIHVKNYSITIKVDDYLLDRVKLEQFFYNLSKVKKIKSFKVSEIIKNKQGYIISDGSKKIKATKIVGADGVKSIVRRTVFPQNEIQFYSGIQSLIKGKFNPKRYDVYLERRYSDALFGWLVPLNEKLALIGVAAYKKTHQYFKHILNDLEIKNEQVIETFGGAIPIFNPRNKVEKDNAYLIGDAAGQVKATTGGGVVQIFKAANLLVKAINNNTSYEKLAKKEINPELKLHRKLHCFVKSLNDKDYEDILKKLSDGNLLEKISINRDSLKQGLIKIAKLALKRPALLKYFPKLLSCMMI